MMYDWGYSSGYDIWGVVFMFLMMTLVIVGTVAVVRYFGRTTASGQRGETALETLKKRYAKGEIDKKEFVEMRKDLSA